MKRKIVIEIISFLFILLFVYAALNKLLDYNKFTIQIGQSPLLTGFGDWIPWMVIVSELLLAVMLLTDRFRKIGLYGSFCIMVMFTIYIGAILNLGAHIPCSCGGVLEKLGWTEHLIFNACFVLLALIAIILYRDDALPKRPSAKAIAVTLSGSLMSSIAVMIGLILFSGVLRDKRNSFLRLFPSHPVLEDRVFDIKYNSYYLAGATAHHIYLGNHSLPLHMLVLNTVDADTQHVRLNIEGIMEQKFWSVQVAVDSPYFYAYDGAVPRIYKGNVTDWHAMRIAHDKEYFLDLVPIRANSLFIKSLKKQATESVLGKITIDSPYYHFNQTVLKKQIDGFFCTDGTMLYNQHLNELIYLYRYRNEYIVMDTSLHKLMSWNTIDTISKAQIKVGSLAGGDTHKMAAPPLTVNRLGATYKNWLFVQSKLLAKNERPDAHQNASVIDVYELTTGIYQFSLYIDHYKNEERLLEFIVNGEYFVARFETHVKLYRLREKYFPHIENDIARVNQERKTEHL